MPLTIRPAPLEDTGLVLRFVRALARHEKAEHEVQATPGHLRQTLFAPQPRVFGLIALDGDTPVGFALSFFNQGLFTPCKASRRHEKPRRSRRPLQGVCRYAQDVQGRAGRFFMPCRRVGACRGRQLLRHLAQIAVAHDCGRFEWSVLDWNAPAIAFYDRLGA